jgi:hypothetical protein
MKIARGRSGRHLRLDTWLKSLDAERFFTLRVNKTFPARTLRKKFNHKGNSFFSLVA